MSWSGADDERPHPPGSEPLWGESWYFDFATADGTLGGYVRLGLYPNRRRAWWWTYVCGEGRRSVVVRDHDVPLPRQSGLELRTEGLWAELTCETPNEHWTVGLEAYGVALDDPADAYHGERGDPVAVGLDLEWEEAGPVYDYSLTTRYEQPCAVHGEVLLGDERFEIDASGERDHSWGVRDWWLFPWCWTAGRLDDGTAFHAAGTDVDGFTWAQGFTFDGREGQHEVARFSVETRLGPEDLPVDGSLRLDDRLELALTTVAHGPVLLESDDGRVGRFPRSLCRFETADGRRGYGWTEWNQPGPVT